MSTSKYLEKVSTVVVDYVSVMTDAWLMIQHMDSYSSLPDESHVS